MCCRDVVEEANKSGKIVKQAVAWTVNTLYAVWAKKAGTAAKFEALVKAQGASEEILKIVHDQLAQCAVRRAAGRVGAHREDREDGARQCAAGCFGR